jgi:hypothetical protein
MDSVRSLLKHSTGMQWEMQIHPHSRPPAEKKNTTWRGGVQRMPPSRNHTRFGELTSPRRLQQQGRRNSSHAFVQLPLFHWSKLDNLVQNPPPRTIIIQIKCDPNARTLQSLSLSFSLSLRSVFGWRWAWLVSSVWKGRRPTGQNSWPANDCDWACSVERGNGLLDRNDGLQFKGLWSGFQCKEGLKRPTGQKWWPAIQGGLC